MLFHDSCILSVFTYLVSSTISIRKNNTIPYKRPKRENNDTKPNMKWTARADLDIVSERNTSLSILGNTYLAVFSVAKSYEREIKHRSPPSKDT